MSEDPYVDPATGVLRNRLGITDAEELARVESDLTAVQMVELERGHLPGRYDLAHLQEFHRFLFGDLYEWAGELRTVAIAKDDLFCLPQFIPSYAQDVFANLARTDFLRGRSREKFINGVAEFLAEINAVHPFREGNGRTQRAFFGQLARDAGHPIDWSSLDATVNIEASQAAHRGDLAPLRVMLEQLVDHPAVPGQASRGEHPARLAERTCTAPPTSGTAPRNQDPHQPPPTRYERGPERGRGYAP